MKGKDILWLTLFSLFLLMILFGCTSSCSGSSHHSSDVDYSERAQELGASTEEYRNAYNYWKYGNP